MAKKCIVCKKGFQTIDYTNVSFLRRFFSPWARVKSRRDTRLCSKHQRRVSQAIKRARFLGLLPYTTR